VPEQVANGQTVAVTPTEQQVRQLPPRALEQLKDFLGFLIARSECGF
jgi:hypothetical protein